MPSYRPHPQIDHIDQTHSELGTTDIQIYEDKTTFTMDVPGLSTKDTRVHITISSLVISGARKIDTNNVECNYERGYGKFSRSFSLGELHEVSNITANLERGVLVVTIPKLESFKQDIPVVDTSETIQTIQPQMSNNRVTRSRSAQNT